MQNMLPAGIRLQIVEVRQPRQYEEAFAAMSNEHPQGLVILGNVLFTQDCGQLADLALSFRLPSVYLFKAFPAAGGLMSYGPSHHEIFDLAAEYIVTTFMLVLHWWVETRSPLSAREVDDLFLSLVVPAVTTGLGHTNG